jgi:hypothetical protein
MHLYIVYESLSAYNQIEYQVCFVNFSALVILYILIWYLLGICDIVLTWHKSNLCLAGIHEAAAVTEGKTTQVYYGYYWCTLSLERRKYKVAFAPLFSMFYVFNVSPCWYRHLMLIELTRLKKKRTLWWRLFGVNASLSCCCLGQLTVYR